MCFDESPDWKSATVVTASNSLKEGSLSHGPQRVIDGNLGSAWCENSKGRGEGDWIELQFPEKVWIEAVHFYGGYFLDARRLGSNGRIKRLQVDADERSYVLSFEDPMVEREGWTPPVTQPDITWFDNASLGAFVQVEESTRKLRLTILEVYPGSKYEDTCISEIRFTSVAPGCGEELGEVEKKAEQ